MCEFGALNKLYSNCFQWFTLNFSSVLIIKTKLKKLYTMNEINIKHHFLLTKRAVESSGGSLSNAEQDVFVVELEASLFPRSPHLPLL